MPKQIATHESLERPEAIAGGSDRGFGLVFAAVCAIVGLLPLWHGGEVRIWWLGAAGAFLAAALAAPAILHPLNRLWFRFGLLLNKIVSPLVMGLIFFVVVTPAALAMRMRGRDPLRLKFDRGAGSYWIKREPPGPSPDSMRNQF